MTKPEKPSDLPPISNRVKMIDANIDQAVSEILAASELSASALKQLTTDDNLNEDQLQLLATLRTANNRIVATCSFQDVIRQHLKILIDDLAKHDHSTDRNNNSEKLLAGPQMDGQGLRQQDVDDLLK